MSESQSGNLPFDQITAEFESVSVAVLRGDALRAAIDALADATAVSADKLVAAVFMAVLHRYSGDEFLRFQYNDEPTGSRMDVAADLSSFLQAFGVADDGAGEIQIWIGSGAPPPEAALALSDAALGEAQLSYNKHQFREATVLRIAKSVEKLLLTLVDSSSARLDSVDLLDPHDRDTLLNDWNDTRTYDLPRLEAMFEEQVAKQADALAIVGPGETITYAELNRRCDRIRNLLTSIQLPTGVVATLVDDGAEQIAAMVGILKAGAAFVCLDPCHPSERLSEIVRESEPDAILFDSASGRHPDLLNLARAQGAVLIDLGASPDVLPNQGAGRQKDVIDIAYMVYTSGSTGKPKGIVQSHRSFSQFIDWQAREVGIGPGSRFIQWASIGYDASYCEIFGALCVGATLCIEVPDVRFNTARLADWADRVEATILQVVPSFCRQLIDVLPQSDALPKVRSLMLAGEALSVDLVRQLRRQLGARVYNLYGPSESVLATFERVSQDSELGSFCSVGRAIDGRQILILDQNQALSPLGAPGEIYIRSAHLTNGYFKRDDETELCYIQNPLHDDFPDPVFRTGDMGRFLADGRIQFLGRNDRLVKLRGMRVELGEIESALRSVNDITECVCIVHTMKRQQDRLTAKDRAAREAVSSGSQFLVAYFSANARLTAVGLRAHLAARLPAHMVPQQFIQMDELPYNANRKLDLKALPSPENTRPELAVDYAAPESEQEALLAGIFTTILGIDKVGVNDGFLDLGGDSLLGMQIINRAKSAGLRLPQQVILRNGSIRDLIAAELRGGDAELPAFERSKERDVYPLTHAEWGLWYLWKVDPDNPFYTAQGSVHLTGEFDLARWVSAWERLVDRHQALRTRFTMHNREPAQTFTDTRCRQVEITDLSHLSSSAARAEMDRINTAAGKYSFHLEDDQLLRAQLFKLSPEHHEFVLTYHEIIFDLWGYAVMIRDLTELYQTTGPLTAAAADLGDFAIWEHEALTRERVVEDEKFWQEELQGQLPVINLPFDRPRSPHPDFSGRGVAAILDASLTADLKTLARDRGVSLFTLIMTAFHLSLRQYSRQDDVIIGAPIANRNAAVSEEIVGWFLNMLPIRIKSDGNSSFSDMLADVHQKTTGALTHANYPFRWMLEWAKVERDTSTAPVFQVMFNWQNLPQPSLSIDGLDISSSEVDSTYKKYDLALYAQEHLDRIYLQYSYLTALFDEETVQRMLSNFVLLLENVCENPDGGIAELTAIAPAERSALLSELSGDEISLEGKPGLYERFVTVASENPEATALVVGGRDISYGALATRVAKLAGAMSGAGAKTSDTVALCVDRGVDTVAAVVATAAIGATHVAISPEYPEQRRSKILSDTGCEIFLHDPDFAPGPEFSGTAISSDSDFSASAGFEPSSGARSDYENIYSIVYTSASTGDAKGVQISERAVINRLEWMWSAYPWRRDDVAVLQKSYSIVAACWEIWGALLQGYPTVVIGADELRDPKQLLKSCAENKVTHLLSSPALIRNILSQVGKANNEWESLRFATTSAEPITPALVTQWREAFPDVPLLNLYGATECSSNVTVHDLTAANDGEPRILLGKPIANTRVYIVDKGMNLVPRGAIGEMCVAGACVASGYHGQSSLTAQKFLPNPFANDGSVIYRTGDLVRLTKSFDIDLVGREDLQVNIRGYRVELGEVEACLEGHPLVSRSAVIAIEHGGSNSLCAYYVASSSGLSVMDLRRHLRERLPDFMIPNQFVDLPDLPRTAAGKIDRLALPRPSIASTGNRKGDAPIGEAEIRVAAIWKQLLNVDTVYRGDKFFDLGGHSLLAVDAANEIEKQFGQEVEFRTIVFADLEEVASKLTVVQQDDKPRKSFFLFWKR